MSALVRTQEAFLNSILADDAALPQGWGARRAEGLAVYRNAYRARLVDSLRETFARTALLAGEDAFHRAAAHHLIVRPPSGWTLDLAGEGFAETCAELFARDPDVAEVAWLEWAMHRAFTASDAEPLDAAGFAATAAGLSDRGWEELRLELLPGTTLRPVAHELVALWQSLAEGGAGEAVVRTLAAPCHALVWREREMPVFIVVPDDEGRALERLANGATFGELCLALGAEADRAGAMLAHWLSLGILRAPGK